MSPPAPAGVSHMRVISWGSFRLTMLHPHFLLTYASSMSMLQACLRRARGELVSVSQPYQVWTLARVSDTW